MQGERHSEKSGVFRLASSCIAFHPRTMENEVASDDVCYKKWMLLLSMRKIGIPPVSTATETNLFATMAIIADEPFTASVLASFGTNASPRAKEILTSLIRHLHAVCREVNLTTAELYLGLDALNRSGRMSDSKRNETLLISDCLGVEA
jgi:hypothetical protein